MYKDPSKKLFIAFIGIILISGCGVESKKDDLDLSGFIKPILQTPQSNQKTNGSKIKVKKEVELKLIPLKDRKEIFNSIKYGKKDPFSVSETESNKFNDDFKLNGFISVKNKDYALVEYKNNKGIININSVGGLNTKLLPKKALVQEINTSQEKINISIEGETYSIKLSL